MVRNSQAYRKGHRCFLRSFWQALRYFLQHLPCRNPSRLSPKVFSNQGRRLSVHRINRRWKARVPRDPSRHCPYPQVPPSQADRQLPVQPLQFPTVQDRGRHRRPWVRALSLRAFRRPLEAWSRPLPAHPLPCCPLPCCPLPCCRLPCHPLPCCPLPCCRLPCWRRWG